MAGATSKQFTMDVGVDRASRGRAAFVPVGAASVALDTADAWRRSARPLLTIAGPPSTGKTHLASILADDLGAPLRSVEEAPLGASPKLAVIDNLERCRDPFGLLDLFEAARGDGGRLVLVGAGQPEDWAQGQRDLVTRLAAADRLATEPPDELLLRAVMRKLFRDRQLSAPETVIAYAAPRIRRRLDAASDFVDAADRLSADLGAPITRRLASKILGDAP